MAQIVAFQASLTQLSFAQPTIAALEYNGITSPQDLVNLDKKLVEQVLKIIRMGSPAIPVPYLAQKRVNFCCCPGQHGGIG
jgi:hypothetical protein